MHSRTRFHNSSTSHFHGKVRTRYFGDHLEFNDVTITTASSRSTAIRFATKRLALSGTVQEYLIQFLVSWRSATFSKASALQIVRYSIQSFLAVSTRKIATTNVAIVNRYGGGGTTNSTLRSDCACSRKWICKWMFAREHPHLLLFGIAQMTSVIPLIFPFGSLDNLLSKSN